MAGAVVLGGVKVTGAWEGDPFPVADPAATAEHLSEQTMAVYDALGVLDGLVLDLRDGLGVKAGIYDRLPWTGARPRPRQSGGGTAPYEPRTTAISAGFTLTGLTHPQAAEAME
ncbi:hypothetical protein ACH4E7_43850 [Kitasatospora sp. NPDC018058]|uniref:hypothetical protein n=1 Tax=Kitasatospora sp. NPDC018058 TaxID=3364025 RepID=UPI0037C0DB9E